MLPAIDVLNAKYLLSFLSIASIAMYVFGYAAFIPYMKKYKFFDCSIFKENKFVFVLAFFLLVLPIIMVLYLPSILSVFLFFECYCVKGFICVTMAICVTVAIIVLIIFGLLAFKKMDLTSAMTLIIFYIVTLITLSTLLCLFLYSKEIRWIIIGSSLIFMFYIFSIFFCHDNYVKLDYSFLKLIGLAHDKVKIYSKNEEKYIEGRLLFRYGGIAILGLFKDADGFTNEIDEIRQIPFDGDIKYL